MLRDREDGRPNNVSQGFTGRFFFTIVFLWEKPLGSHGVFFFFSFCGFFLLFPPHNSKVEDLSLGKNRTLCPQVVGNTGLACDFQPERAEGTMVWLALPPTAHFWKSGQGLVCSVYSRDI